MTKRPQSANRIAKKLSDSRQANRNIVTKQPTNTIPRQMETHGMGDTAPIGIGAAPSGVPAIKSRPEGASGWVADLRAACAANGIRQIARLLGYRQPAPVWRVLTGSDRSPAPVHARWVEFIAGGRLAELEPRVRKVYRRGIRWQGAWLHHTALADRVGRRVVTQGDGLGGLIVYAGMPMRPVCVLTAPSIQHAEAN